MLLRRRAPRPLRSPLSRRLIDRASLAALVVLALASPGWADISGTVVDGGGNPVADALVGLQAQPGTLPVLTAADGTFTLTLADPGAVNVGVAVVYDPDAAVNYATEAVSLTNPSVGNLVVLEELPSVEDPAYDPSSVAASCALCHSEIVDEWSGSVHSTATEDFWVRDIFSGDGSPGGSAGFVYIDTHDPGDTGTCATCHSPIADSVDPGNIRLNDAYDSGDPAYLDGVSCIACHQLHRVGDPDGIHTVGGSEYRFPDGTVPTNRHVWGPLPDVETGFMRAGYAPVFTESRFCASCHEYQAPFGQTTYTEWLGSEFAVAGPGFRSCQDCHMPERGSAGPICDLGSPPDRPASQRHAHTFIGSTPQTLADNLDLALDVEQEMGTVTVRASVTNRGAGHDFPTGVSIRNALLVITAEVDGTPLAQVSGPTVPEWADDDVPGRQEGDYAGFAGKGFAKILEGRINGQGEPVWPVLFVDAEIVREKTNIPSGATDITEVVFQVPSGTFLGDPLVVEARLLYRRALRALAVTKGWTVTPQGGAIEIEAAALREQQPLQSAPVEIPTLDTIALGLLALVLAVSGVARLVVRAR